MNQIQSKPQESKFQPQDVVKSLLPRNDVRVDVKNKIVYVLTRKVWDSKKRRYVHNHLRKNDLGNSSWGKIDFLTRHEKFDLTPVFDFSLYDKMNGHHAKRVHYSSR